MLRKNRNFEENTHFFGRIWGITLVLILFLFPIVLCFAFNTAPDWKGFGSNAAGIMIMYWAVCLVEFFTYVPMLGSAGSYLSFVTGNLTTLKVPCALNAMTNANVSANSEEGELISTIAIAVSSIVTTLILAVGVLLIAVSGFGKVLESEVLKPAFSNVLPALFGGLGIVFISRNWKVAVAPVVLSLVLFIAVPSLGSSGAIFVPVFAIISILVARFLYVKGYLDERTPLTDTKTTESSATQSETISEDEKKGE